MIKWSLFPAIGNFVFLGTGTGRKSWDHYQRIARQKSDDEFYGFSSLCIKTYRVSAAKFTLPVFLRAYEDVSCRQQNSFSQYKTSFSSVPVVLRGQRRITSIAPWADVARHTSHARNTEADSPSLRYAWGLRWAGQGWRCVAAIATSTTTRS